jgi:hypothetical protein
MLHSFPSPAPRHCPSTPSLCHVMSHASGPVHCTNELHTSTIVSVPSQELGLPHPLSRKRVCTPPPQTKEGEHTHQGVRRWGRPNSDDMRKSLALCLLCAVTMAVTLPPRQSRPPTSTILQLTAITLAYFLNFSATRRHCALLPNLRI